VARVTDKDNDPAGAAEPEGVDACAKTPAWAEGDADVVLGELADRLGADGQDPRLLWPFAEDVRQILDRCGIDVFSAEPGDPFDRFEIQIGGLDEAAAQEATNAVARYEVSG
jgi:hypothetical protein